MNWIYRNSGDFYLNGTVALEEYFGHLKKRREKHPYGISHLHMKEFKKNGFCKIPQVFSAEMIGGLNQEFQACVKQQKVKHDDEYFTMIGDPLLNSKTSFDIAVSDVIFDFSRSFFKCTPSLCTQNLRLSKLNEKQPKSTQLFHCDQNSLSFIKCFIYLNDVDLEGGPLTYVKGSHAKKPQNHLKQYRWSKKEMIDLYGEQSITYLTASSGDLLIADTTGFHCGTKPQKIERKMLTLNYVIHKERNTNRLFKTKKEWVNDLPEEKKPLFDFMETV